MKGIVQFDRYQGGHSHFVQVEQVVRWQQTSCGTVVTLVNGDRLEVGHTAEHVAKLVSEARQ